MRWRSEGEDGGEGGVTVDDFGDGRRSASSSKEPITESMLLL